MTYSQRQRSKAQGICDNLNHFGVLCGWEFQIAGKFEPNATFNTNVEAERAADDHLLECDDGSRCNNQVVIEDNMIGLFAYDDKKGEWKMIFSYDYEASYEFYHGDFEEHNTFRFGI